MQIESHTVELYSALLNLFDCKSYIYLMTFSVFRCFIYKIQIYNHLYCLFALIIILIAKNLMREIYMIVNWFFFAQEMFVKNLATISREKSKDKMNVNYKDLAEVVNSDDVLQFLQGTCKKIVKHLIKSRCNTSI